MVLCAVLKHAIEGKKLLFSVLHKNFPVTMTTRYRVPPSFQIPRDLQSFFFFFSPIHHSFFLVIAGLQVLKECIACALPHFIF